MNQNEVNFREKRIFKIEEVYSLKNIQDAIKLKEMSKQLSKGEITYLIKSEIIDPSILDINQRTNQENDALYLASYLNELLDSLLKIAMDEQSTRALPEITIQDQKLINNTPKNTQLTSVLKAFSNASQSKMWGEISVKLKDGEIWLIETTTQSKNF